MTLISPRAGRAGWLLLLAAMAAVGALQMRYGVAGLRPSRISADATSETLLATVTGEPGSLATLAAAFAELPGDRPVLILRPVNQVETSLAAYLVAYHAMPRSTLIREVQLADSPAAVEELRREFSAVVFVGQSPPSAFPAGQPFGRAFVFVPLIAAP